MSYHFLEFLSNLKIKKLFLRERFGGGVAWNYVPPVRGFSDLVFGRVLFEQTTMWCYSHDFIDHCCILKFAIRQPNLHDAEILFGGNGDAIHHRQQRLVGRNAVSNQHICQLTPTIWHIFVTNFI